MATIAIVEDDETTAACLSYSLRRLGHGVTIYSDGNMASEALLAERPHLIVLDLMLPGMDGLDLCRTIRRVDQRTPILMSTARGEEIDRVVGLESGADDYVVKPFSVREVEARVKILLRRGSAAADRQTPLSVGPFTLETHRGILRQGEEQTPLTRRQTDLLAALMERRGSVIPREDLLRKVWGEDYEGESKTLDVHIRWLREKIEPDPGNPRYIVTIRGRGYRFDTVQRRMPRTLAFRIHAVFLLCAFMFAWLAGTLVQRLALQSTWRHLEDSAVMLAHSWEESGDAERVPLPSGQLPLRVTVVDASSRTLYNTAPGSAVVDAPGQGPPRTQSDLRWSEVKEALQGRIGRSTRDGYDWVAVPLYKKSGALGGALRVGVPMQAVAESLVPLRRLLLVTLLGSLAFALLLSRILTRMLSQPLQRLRQAVNDPRPLPEDGPLEVGRLARAFNETRTAMHRQVAALEDEHQRLASLDRMRREFVANASHELRTPLGALIASLEVLQRGAKDDAAQRDEFITRARQQADRLRRLADDLLNLTAAEEPPLAGGGCDAARVCAEQAENVLAAAHERGQTVNLEMGRETVRVAMAEGDLARVVGNLLDNAIKYTPRGGTILVAVRSLQDGAEIAVSDDGVGIPPGDLQRVFERFYRVDKARSRDQGGAGLGLAIAQQLVTRHGGGIQAQHLEPHGTRIRITLPAAVPQPVSP